MNQNCDEQQAVVEASGKKLLTVSDHTTLTTKSLLSFSKNEGVVTVETQWKYEESQKTSECSQAENLEHRPTPQSHSTAVVRRKRYKRTTHHGERFSQ